MSRIGVIGTGHIAAPMVRFLAARGHALTVTRRSAPVSAALARLPGVTIAEPQAVLDGSDTVLLCLRPQHAEAALAPLAFRADHAIVSVMAGVSLATLARLCGPATELCRTIPLGYLEQGGCPLAACGDTTRLAALFAPENPVIAVRDEPALNAHFAICAMVPGLLDLMATGADWLGARTGDRDAADAYTAQLVAGFLSTLPAARPGRLARERDALATPGTLSLQMVDGLRTGGATRALRTTLDAIGDRLG